MARRICQIKGIDFKCVCRDHLLVIVNVVNIVNLFIITLKMNNQKKKSR